MIVRTNADKLIIRAAPGGADTGLRFLRGQTAEATAVSADNKWHLINAPAGTGWASSQYLISDLPAPRKRLYTLEGEDPELTANLEKLARFASTEGIEFDTADFGGVRTEADTVKILKYRDDDYAVYVRELRARKPGATPVPKTTWRPINPWGTSMHNYGCARDLKITRKPQSMTESHAMERLGDLAPKCGLVWGGTFRRFDGPHMQLDLTLSQAKARWEDRQ